jgi:hypothetical protein
VVVAETTTFYEAIAFTVWHTWVSRVNQLSSYRPILSLASASEKGQMWRIVLVRCNTAADDSMEDMPSTVCVSGTHRILVDVMVAQLSRVQDRAVVLQRSNTTRIGRG